MHCQDKPVAEIDYGRVAAATPEYSGADIAALVDVAVEAKLRVAMRTGVPVPLSTTDLLAAVKQVRPSTKEWFASARNYATFSNEGGIYDDVLRYLGGRRR